MIKYYKKFTSSISEINNSPSIIIHSLGGCNFNCYKCFNYDQIVKNASKQPWITIDGVVDKLYRLYGLYEYVVLSGGEFLLYPIEDVLSDIAKIKSVTDAKIIIYTNGTFPDKIKAALLDDNVSGVHLDWKLPFQEIEAEQDKLIVQTVIGKELSEQEIKNQLESFDVVFQYDKGYNQIRSVKYPMLDPSVFDDSNLRFSTEVNTKYGKHVPYVVNPFFENNS